METEIKNRKIKNKIHLIPKSLSKERKNNKNVFIKKFEMKLPNFKHVKIR